MLVAAGLTLWDPVKEIRPGDNISELVAPDLRSAQDPGGVPLRPALSAAGHRELATAQSAGRASSQSCSRTVAQIEELLPDLLYIDATVDPSAEATLAAGVVDLGT